MINFCRIYNKYRLKLDKDFEKVDEINIITGLLILVILLIAYPFIICINIAVDITERLFSGIRFPLKRDSSLSTSDSIISVAFAMFTIGMSYLIMKWLYTTVFIIPASIIVYMFVFSAISFLILPFKESLGWKVFDITVFNPIKKIGDITTSKCNLKEHNHGQNNK